MCAEHIPPCQGYWDASVVFSGVVTEISSRPAETRQGEGTHTPDEAIIHFTAEKYYRDNRGAEVQVSTGLGGGDCGYSFRVGERYLVYAQIDKERQELTTSICTLTKPLVEAEEDLRYIGSLSAEPDGTLLYGIVSDYTPSRETLAGVDVQLEGPQGVRHVLSDGAGKYEWKGLPAGRYRLAATFPNYIPVARGGIEFNLVGKGCRRLNLSLQSNGQISGRVYASDGALVPKQDVELAAAEGNGLAELHAETNEEGQYHFSGVHPGQFVVGVNLSTVPNAKNPYLRTYSPSAQKRQNALVVDLRKGEIVAGQDIYLGRRVEARDVEGVIVWQDGKPAANANISLSYPDYPWWTDSKPGPDSQGRFSVQVLRDLPTILSVQGQNAAGIWMSAGEVELPTQGLIKPMRLVLSHQPQK
jgi:Carboxypeptidase regulatory-like domain